MGQARDATRVLDPNPCSSLENPHLRTQRAAGWTHARPLAPLQRWRLVRQLDRLEMGLQACIYEGQGAGDLSEFFASVHQALETPELKALLAELERLRPGKRA